MDSEDDSEITGAQSDGSCSSDPENSAPLTANDIMAMTRDDLRRACSRRKLPQKVDGRCLSVPELKQQLLDFYGLQFSDTPNMAQMINFSRSSDPENSAPLTANDIMAMTRDDLRRACSRRKLPQRVDGRDLSPPELKQQLLDFYGLQFSDTPNIAPLTAVEVLLMTRSGLRKACHQHGIEQKTEQEDKSDSLMRMELLCKCGQKSFPQACSKGHAMVHFRIGRHHYPGSWDISEDESRQCVVDTFVNINMSCVKCKIPEASGAAVYGCQQCNYIVCLVCMMVSCSSRVSVLEYLLCNEWRRYPTGTFVIPESCVRGHEWLNLHSDYEIPEPCDICHKHLPDYICDHCLCTRCESCRAISWRTETHTPITRWLVHRLQSCLDAVYHTSELSRSSGSGMLDFIHDYWPRLLSTTRTGPLSVRTRSAELHKSYRRYCSYQCVPLCRQVDLSKCMVGFMYDQHWTVRKLAVESLGYVSEILQGEYEEWVDMEIHWMGSLFAFDRAQYLAAMENAQGCSQGVMRKLLELASRVAPSAEHSLLPRAEFELLFATEVGDMPQEIYRWEQAMSSDDVDDFCVYTRQFVLSDINMHESMKDRVVFMGSKLAAGLGDDSGQVRLAAFQAATKLPVLVELHRNDVIDYVQRNDAHLRVAIQNNDVDVTEFRPAQVQNDDTGTKRWVHRFRSIEIESAARDRLPRAGVASEVRDCVWLKRQHSLMQRGVLSDYQSGCLKSLCRFKPNVAGGWLSPKFQRAIATRRTLRSRVLRSLQEFGVPAACIARFRMSWHKTMALQIELPSDFYACSECQAIRNSCIWVDEQEQHSATCAFYRRAPSPLQVFQDQLQQRTILELQMICDYLESDNGARPPKKTFLFEVICTVAEVQNEPLWSARCPIAGCEGELDLADVCAVHGKCPSVSNAEKFVEVDVKFRDWSFVNRDPRGWRVNRLAASLRGGVAEEFFGVMVEELVGQCTADRRLPAFHEKCLRQWWASEPLVVTVLIVAHRSQSTKPSFVQRDRYMTRWYNGPDTYQDKSPQCRIIGFRRATPREAEILRGQFHCLVTGFIPKSPAYWCLGRGYGFCDRRQERSQHVLGCPFHAESRYKAASLLTGVSSSGRTIAKCKPDMVFLSPACPACVASRRGGHWSPGPGFGRELRILGSRDCRELGLKTCSKVVETEFGFIVEDQASFAKKALQRGHLHWSLHDMHVWQLRRDRRDRRKNRPKGNCKLSTVSWLDALRDSSSSEADCCVHDSESGVRHVDLTEEARLDDDFRTVHLKIREVIEECADLHCARLTAATFDYFEHHPVVRELLSEVGCHFSIAHRDYVRALNARSALDLEKGLFVGSLKFSKGFFTCDDDYRALPVTGGVDVCYWKRALDCEERTERVGESSHAQLMISLGRAVVEEWPARQETEMEMCIRLKLSRRAHSGQGVSFCFGDRGMQRVDKAHRRRCTACQLDPKNRVFYYETVYEGASHPLDPWKLPRRKLRSKYDGG